VNIAAFAQRCGLSAHTLRYYDRIGLLRSVARRTNGHREFGPADVEWVEFLHRLRSSGMGIAEMQHYAALRAQGDTTLALRRALLDAHAARIEGDLQQRQIQLARLREKIRIYDTMIATADRTRRGAA